MRTVASISADLDECKRYVTVILPGDFAHVWVFSPTGDLIVLERAAKIFHAQTRAAAPRQGTDQSPQAIRAWVAG
jgi:hypothetical protein